MKETEDNIREPRKEECSGNNDCRVTRKRKQKQHSEDLAVIVVAVVPGHVTDEEVKTEILTLHLILIRKQNLQVC